MKHILRYEVCTAVFGTYTLIELKKQGKVYFCVKAMPKSATKVLQIIGKHAELISGPRPKNLFETESLLDYLHPSLLYKDTIVYTKASIEKQLHELVKTKKNDAAWALFGTLEYASDEYILQLLADKAVIRGENGCMLTINGQISESTHPVEERFEPLSYSKIIAEVRKTFNIKKRDAIDLDDFIAYSAKSHLEKFLGDSTQDLNHLAYMSSGKKAFRKKMIALADTMPSGQFSVEMDGFASVFNNDLDNPELTISYLGACISHNTKKATAVPLVKEVVTIEGERFWQEAWYEMYRMYETRLKNTQDAELAALREKLVQLKKTFSEESVFVESKEEMSAEKIAALYYKRYGTNISNQTVRNYLKKGLGIMREYFDSASLKLEDLICV